MRLRWDKWKVVKDPKSHYVDRMHQIMGENNVNMDVEYPKEIPMLLF